MMSSHVTSNADDDDNNNSSSGAASLSKPSRWHTSSVLKYNEKIERQFPRLVFDPDSGLVCHWTAAVAIAFLYNAWMIALRIAFPEIRYKDGPTYLVYLDLLSDFVYLMDILVQLRTAYLQDGIPVFDPSKIRQQYMSQTYFVRDLISVLPSQTILSFLPDRVGCYKYFFCTAGAARLTRLVKFHILYRFYDLAESLTSNPHLIRVLRLFLNLAVIIHWIACLYYLLSEFEGLGSNAWVYTNSTDQQRFTRKYIVCLYWSTMTLTTIGNTNSPETDMEYIFTGVIFLTGVFVFATVMGNVADVISSMNANRQEFQARMDHIKMYLTHKKVPASLQLKIKKWAEYTWSRTKATDESRLLNMLPERLRAEVAVHVHLDSLKKVKIFEQCETGFLCELVLKLRSQVFSPGDYVCRAGETGREMFIINHGKVEVLVPSSATNKDMVVAVLSEGNYFGEISLLRLDGVQNRRTADVRSIGYAELLCLSRRDLMSALVEYPEAKSVLESQAKKRMRTSLQAQKAFSVDSLLRNSQDHSSVDSGIAGREETRGHDVSEIKAMIEDLKNSNKVPGRTVWQLIARCEVLQAKLSEKEKEIDDSKQRVKELEDLLVTRHCSNQQTSLSSDNEIDADKNLLRPSIKVTKQYSQDEGRQTVFESVVGKQKLPKQKESLMIPDVTVTSPPPTSYTPFTGERHGPGISKAIQENNFIKTSKITHVDYDCNEEANSTEAIRFRSNDSNKEEYSSDLSSVEHEDQLEDSPITYKIHSERTLQLEPNGSYINKASFHQSIVLTTCDRSSFTSSYEEQVCLKDSFEVETIPEEDEDMEELEKNSSRSTSTSTVKYFTDHSNQNTLHNPSDGHLQYFQSTDSKCDNSGAYSLSPPDLLSTTYVPCERSSRGLTHLPLNDNVNPQLKEFSRPHFKSCDTQCKNNALNSKSSYAQSPHVHISTIEDQNCKGGTNQSMQSSTAKSNIDTSQPFSSSTQEDSQSCSKDSIERRLSRDEAASCNSQSSSDFQALDRLCSSLEETAAPLHELEDGFHRMGSLHSCISENSNSRRSSWSWDSEYETEEEVMVND